jgi:prepilin-type N-terminal cleavage/methylation domain-containing protein
MTNQKGFSLVELMVVVSILSIIALVAMPRYNSYKARAARNTMQYTMVEMARAYKAFYLLNEAPPSAIEQIMDVPVGTTQLIIGPYTVAIPNPLPSGVATPPTITATATSLCVNGTSDVLSIDLSAQTQAVPLPDGLTGCL